MSGSGFWHVVPEDDEREHDISCGWCHCQPRIKTLPNGEKMVVHRCYDGREFVEKAEEIFNDPDKYLPR